jgi:hypothetical protein
LTRELDEYWARVSIAVKTGDLEAYRATCHPDGILVSGKGGKSELLSEALVRWGKEFADTKAGKMKAQVEFRFSDRKMGKNTVHETGIFLYSSQKKGEEWKQEYVHFEALLVKKKRTMEDLDGISKVCCFPKRMVYDASKIKECL